MAEAEVAKTDGVKELETFVLHEQKVVTVGGETIDVPRCAWGKELKIVNMLKEILHKLIESGVMQGGPKVDFSDLNLAEEAGQDTARQRMQLAQNQLLVTIADMLFESAPERLGKAVAVLLNKPVAWIEENLESEVMLELLLPFLQSKRLSLGKVFERFANQAAPAPAA